MSRFKVGDKAILNYRRSKTSRYEKLGNGRLAECVKYLGDSTWQVKEKDTDKLRKWLTADMTNFTLVANKIKEEF